MINNAMGSATGPGKAVVEGVEIDEDDEAIVVLGAVPQGDQAPLWALRGAVPAMTGEG